MPQINIFGSPVVPTCPVGDMLALPISVKEPRLEVLETPEILTLFCVVVLGLFKVACRVCPATETLALPVIEDKVPKADVLV